MRCLLDGHKPRRFPGHGAHKDQEFDICVECGKTWSVVDGVRADEPLTEQERSRVAN